MAGTSSLSKSLQVHTQQQMRMAYRALLRQLLYPGPSTHLGDSRFLLTLTQDLQHPAHVLLLLLLHGAAGSQLRSPLTHRRGFGTRAGPS